MKLAEALIIRGDIQSKIKHLQTRLHNNATVQDGETSVENPNLLLNEFEESLATLQDLIAKINLTNSKIKKGELTMTEMLAKRECLKIKVNLYKDFLYNASNLTKRSRVTEIKIRSNINVSEFQKLVDSTSAELRRLDIDIQELNWTAELID